MTDTSMGAWHPDPTGRHQHRWWDGTQWTDHVSDGGVTSTDPMNAAPAVPLSGSTTPPASTSGPNWKVIGLVGGAVVVVVILLVVLLGGSDSGPSRDQVVDQCVHEGGTSRSDCECIVDEYLDAGGSLDDLPDDDEDFDAADLPDGFVEAAFACAT